MTEVVTNRLLFLSNAKTILPFIKSQNPGGQGPSQFSLNSVRPMPDGLMLPLTDAVMRLSVMNAAMPDLDEAARQVALTHLFFGQPEKASAADIAQAVEAARSALQKETSENGHEPAPGSDKSAFEVFEQAVANYKQHQYFSYYDWRLANWGAIEDIHAVVPSTFELPTTCIEFQTTWTPPIEALRYLAQVFPSVRFELTYHYHADDPWTKVEIFPITPFGY